MNENGSMPTPRYIDIEAFKVSYKMAIYAGLEALKDKPIERDKAIAVMYTVFEALDAFPTATIESPRPDWTPCAETTSEPTTGEIVKMLRTIENAAQVVLDGGFGTRDGENDIVYRTRRNTAKFAADRLESQEQTISALTARAEQAERERDAAVEHVHDAIFGTNHSCFYCTMENCDGCTNSTVKEHFKYRGLLPRKYLVKNEGETE